MFYFNSIQEGLAFAFNGFNINTINIKDSPEPYFIGPQLVPIFNVKNSYYLTRYLNDSEYINIHMDSENRINFAGPFNGLANSSMIRDITLISLGGVFALCNRLYNRNNNVAQFAYYINHTILPTLWNNPNLVQEINKRQMCHIIDKSKYPYNNYETLKNEIPELRIERDNLINRLAYLEKTSFNPISIFLDNEYS